LTDVTPQGGLAALVTELLELFQDRRTDVTLLGRQMFVLAQQFVNALLEGPQNRGRARRAPRVCLRLGRCDGLAHGFAGDVQLFGDLPQAFLVVEVRPPDLLTVFHSDHPSLRYRGFRPSR